MLGDKIYVEKMPVWPESDEIWGTYSQKTVKIAGKMHGEFPVIFKLFFAIIPSILARFGPIWHFFNMTIVALDF